MVNMKDRQGAALLHAPCFYPVQNHFPAAVKRNTTANQKYKSTATAKRENPHQVSDRPVEPMASYACSG